MTAGGLDALVDSLTLEEQVALLAGVDFWHTAPIERAGIPSMRVSDGPAGARGTQFAGGPVSINVPCSTALAASFDPLLVRNIGRLLGTEARTKGARVLLAPTVNLHRTPIGGRNFECMSEDPYLTARICVEYVNGLQSEGVAACIKHFVGNDTEFERNTINSVIDERTLRELYLVPFEAAVRDADVQAVMTSYNRINGPFAADAGELINGVLRGEWGFQGLVMSDWFGLHSTVEGIVAGVDLEMPGPTRHRGAKLVDAVNRGDVDRGVIRARALNVLAFMERVGALADGGPADERPSDADEQDIALVRSAASAGMVLLRNEEHALPLALSMTRVAVIGPNAATGGIMGGGSAIVAPTSVSHPLAALQERLESAGVDVSYAVGCTTFKRLPLLDMEWCSPLRAEFFRDLSGAERGDGEADRVSSPRSARLMWFADPIDGVSEPQFSARITTTITPPVSGQWSISVTSVADVQLSVDGQLVIDNADVAPGGSFFGWGKPEVVATVELREGQPHDIEVLWVRPPSTDRLSALLIGAYPPVEGDPIDDAEAMASGADAAIVIVGTNDDWESEGFDRDDLGLPGRQDELISRIAAVSDRTIVVVNAGSPVAMPWLDEVDAVLYTWFPGQEMGHALCDVLFGDAEPSGRLPVTFPHRLEDTPAFEHYPGRNGEAHYLERRLVGYRWYDTVGREPLFPFGFGLGYTTMAFEEATLTGQDTVEVLVHNTGDRDGYEVVQVYAHLKDRDDVAPDEPDQRLVGFTKVLVQAGGRVSATVRLDRNAYRTWDESAHQWSRWHGAVELRVGTSSRDVTHRLEVSVSPLTA
jgi:beta-glucosidase